MMKRMITLLMTAVLMTALPIAGFAKENYESPNKIKLTEEELSLVKKNNNFAFNLMRQAQCDGNQVLSPLSITFALGMLNNSAAGQTQKEINEVLGFGDAGADAINAFCRKMLDESGKLDESTRVDIANTIYVNNGYVLQEKFVETANKYYDATPESRNFQDGKTMDVINQWASDHTEGMIQNLLNGDTFDPDAVSYLLNAIYFKGQWMMPFDKDLTSYEPFNKGDQVPMMHKTDGVFTYAENDLYQAIILPYGNASYQMTVYLPREGKTINDLLAKMDGSNWQCDGSMHEVDLKLPRFETETNEDLKPIMQALGMPRAFDEILAEFPYFCNAPVYIEMMRQSAKIKLDEEGTEAAAVTIIGITEKAMPASAVFHANRPFLYIISEQSTGAIFFIGQYKGGLTAGVDAMQQNKNNATSAPVYNLNGQRLTTPPDHGLYIQDGKKVVRK